jgi:type I restriction enzyme S subunit
VTKATTYDGWREVTLGEIFEISSSKRVLQEQWKTSGVPFYRAREIVKLAMNGVVENELFISEELFDEYREKYGVPAPGDLMVSAVGTLGACYVVKTNDRFYYKDASVLRFSPKVPIDSKFIQFAFGTNQILDQVNAGSGSTVGTFTIERANKTRLPLPPLAEQRRIATVLDRAEALRAKRRAALAQLDSLIQSVFPDLFGDPVTNPKGWPVSNLGEVTKFFAGTTLPDGVEFAGQDDGYFLLKVSDMNLPDNETSLVTCQQWSSLPGANGCTCPAGSVVIPKRGGAIGTNKKRLSTRSCILDPNLMAIWPKPKEIELAFLYQWFMQLDLSTITSGSSVPQLNKRDLAPLRIPIPPISLQRDFARRVKAVEKLKTTQRTSLAELDALFASLQHRAFRGEL